MADDFGKEYVCKPLKHLFLHPVSYNRFVAPEKEVLLPLPSSSGKSYREMYEHSGHRSAIHT